MVVRLAVMGLGNVSLYVFSLLSSVVFLVLGAAATTQAVRHSRTVGGTLRAAALAAVASFAWLRVINNGAHVVRAYVGMADVMKHLLFVVPLAFAFSAFSVIIFLWLRIAHVIKSDVPPRVKWFFGLSNGAVWLMVAISVVLHFSYKGHRNEFIVIGWTNTMLALCFIGGGLAFATFGGLVMAQFRSVRGTGAAASSPRVSAALRRVATLMGVCCGCFAVSCCILLYEGTHLIRTGTFVDADGEYTTTPLLEWLLFVGQTLPQCALVYVLWRGPFTCMCRPSDVGGRKSRGSLMRPPTSSSSAGSTARKSGTALRNDGDSDEAAVRVPLLGIAADVSSAFRSNNSHRRGAVEQTNPVGVV